MSVRSKALGTDVSSGAPVVNKVLGTVPAGSTWILKDIRIANFSGLAATVSVGVLRPSTNAAAIVVDQSINNGAIVGVSCFVVAEPADQLLYSSTQNAVEIWCSGAELDGVAA